MINFGNIIKGGVDCSKKMFNKTLTVTLLVAVVLSCLLMTTNSQPIDYHKVLDEFVWERPDPVYSYKPLYQYATQFATVHVLNMTSCQWLTKEELGIRSVWFHYLEIAIPHNLDQKKKDGLLLISGGSQNSNPPTGDTELSMISFATQTIATALRQIPNQPIVFNSDPLKKSRVEDAILAYAWARFMNNTKDTDWIPRLPMVKASIKAMDTIQEYVEKVAVPGFKMEHFHVAGASKRGWTTWLVGAVDTKRVKTIIPIVIPVAKTRDILEHTYNSICGWPRSMGDYVNEGITGRLNSPEFDLLTQVIDPFEYRHKLAKTSKYMVNAVGDEFFWPDLSQFSYQQLDGGDQHRHLYYVPNADHSLSGTDALLAVTSFYYGAMNGLEMPIYNFTAEYGTYGMSLELRVLNGKTPTKVLLWQAFNANGRDFRVETIGRSWVSTPIEINSDLHWKIFVKNPLDANSYTSFFIEMTFDNYWKLPISAPLKFTTSAYILPNTLPCKY